MPTATFADFEADALARGFDEVVTREWPPSAVLETHVHPFAVEALVVRGELWLTGGETTQHLCAGERFRLGREVPHAERYGSEGATVWVARRAGTADAAAAG